eukprot:jgi/Hompol1/6978/HPOL_005135-RA
MDVSDAEPTAKSQSQSQSQPQPQTVDERTILVKQCGVQRSKNQHPVLLTVPMSWSRTDQERATQILFEYINAPGIYLLEQPLAALYGIGVVSGLVVDIGHATTDIVAVFDNIVQYSSAVTLPLGGQDIDAYLLQLMQEDAAFVEECGPDQPTLEMARALKESPLFTAPINSQVQLPVAEFEFKGRQIKVGAIRGKAINVLFDPLLTGKDIIGLHEAIQLVISRMFEPEKRLFLWENVLLTGGCSLISGIQSRIERELAPLLSASETSNEFQPKELKWVRIPDYFVSFKDQPCDAAFLGASVTAKLVFSSGGMYISKADYAELGPAAPFLK